MPPIQGAGDTGADALDAAHDVDLLLVDLTDPAVVAALGLRDKPDHLAALMQHQRLLRLCEGDAELARWLSAAGVSSAHDVGVAALDPALEADAAGAPSEARLARVHRVAADTRARARLLSSILHGVRAPHYRHSRFANAHPELVARAHDTGPGPLLDLAAAGTTTLTGLDDRPDAFSPSAYLWSLREFIKDNINAEEGEGLADRRQDLFSERLPEDRGYSEDELPYLDLVNELLLQGLAAKRGLSEDEALRYLANEARFPFGLPFHAPLAAIRAWLGQLGTDLATIFDRMGVDADVTARERLRLSNEQGTQLITTDIDASWGLKGSADRSKLAEVATFMSRSGIGFDRTVELVQQDLSDVDENKELRKLFFINSGDRGTDPLAFASKDGLLYLTDARLDRIQRFVRLADHLGWSLTDLDTALRSLSSDPDITTGTLTRLATVEQLRVRLKQPLELVCCLWSDMRTSGVQRREAPRTLFDRVFNEPVPFLRDGAGPYHPKEGKTVPYSRNPTCTDEPVAWTPATRTGPDARIRTRLLAALSLQDEELTHLADKLFPGTSPIVLNVPNLSRLHRTSRLASLLGHSPADLIALRDLIGVADLDSPERVLRLVQWSDGLKAAGVTVAHLRYLCGDPAAPGAADPTVDTGYVPSDVLPFVKKLPMRDAVQTIDADALRGALGDDSEPVLRHLRDKGHLDARGMVQTPSGEISYRWLAETLADLQTPLPTIAVSSLRFDGQFHVDFGDLDGVHPTGSFTVELWFRAPYSPTSQYLVRKGGHMEYPGHGLLWNAGYGSPGYLAVKFGAPKQQLQAVPRPEQIDAWTHVAYTWDASEGIARVYLDGVEQSRNIPTPKPTQGMGERLTLSYHERRVSGRLHDLRLWDRARTADEIQSDMHRRLTGMEPGLVCCWPVDEGQGTTIGNRVTGKPNGAVVPAGHQPTWDTADPPPTDQRLVAVVDALLAARRSFEAAAFGIPTALASFFSAPQAWMEPALALAAARGGTGDPLAALTGPLCVPADEALLYKLFAHLAHVIVLTRTLKIRPDELAALPRTFASFGIAKLTDPLTATQVLNLHAYRELADTWTRLPPGLLAVLLAEPEDRVTALATSAEWPEAELKAAMSAIKPPISDLSQVTELVRLHRLCLVCRRLGLDIASLAKLAALTGEVNDKTTWETYKAGAVTALEAANAKTALDQWAAIAAPVRDRQSELRRDAVGGHYGHLLGFEERLEDLYERLLIDVEMSGCARINRLKEALNSFQLYAHRVAAGLEPDAAIEDRAAWDKAWPLMSQYRAWEASQRLLVHTESFIDPTLRALKTTAYADVERDLLQSDLSDAAASAAFLRYLKVFETVANLEPVSAAYARVTTPELPTETPTIFLVGRTRSPAPEYYWRRATVGVVNRQLQITRWWPWEKLLMGAAIQATSVTPVWVFGRLHLLWVSQREEVHTRSKGGDSIKSSGVFASVQFIRQDGANGWTEPRALVKDLLIHVMTEERWASVEDKAATRKIIHAAFPDFDSSGQTDWMLDTRPAETCWTEACPIVMKTHRGEELVVLFGVIPQTSTTHLNIAAARLLDADGVTRRASPSRLQQSGARPNVAWTFSGPPTLKVGVGAAAFSLLAHDYLGMPSGGSTSLAERLDPGAVARPVKGLISCTLLDNGDEAFLIFPGQTPLEEVELQRFVTCSLEGGEVLVITEEPRDLAPETFAFDRVSTATVAPMLRRLSRGGLPLLLHPDGQSLFELPWSRLGPTARAVPLHSDLMDFAGPFGCYFWEIFVWLPFVVANALHGRQRFDEAQRWIERLYDPHAPGLEDSGRATYKVALAGTLDNSGTAKNRVGYGGQPPQWQADAALRGREEDKRTVLKLASDPQSPPFIVLNDPFDAPAPDGFTLAFWLHVSPQGAPVRVFHSQVGDSVSIAMTYDPAAGGALTTVLSWDGTTPKDIASFKVKLDAPGAPLEHVALVYHAAEGRIVVFLNGEPQALTRDLVPAPLPDRLAHLWFQCDTKPSSLLLADLVLFPRPLSHADLYELRLAADRPWRAMPLRGHTLAKLLATIHDLRNVSAYTQGSGAADVVAQLNVTALQKAIVMRTIDNMVDWGDKLFGEDSWESNVRATMLYVAAGDILGPRPPGIPSWTGPQLGQDTEGAEGPASVHHEQHLLPTGEEHWTDERSTPPPEERFPIPFNPELIGYWDLIDDRLYKLRHCMNLAGEVRQLALFQPPMDPRVLVARQASQGSAAALLAGGAGPTLPFTELIEHAKLTTFRVTQLGKTVLQAIEGKDNADLFMMALKHEREALDRETAIKAGEIEEQAANLEALYRGRGRILAQGAYETAMLTGADGTPLEIASMVVRVPAIGMLFGRLSGLGSAVPASLIPNIFGTANGGFSPESFNARLADCFGTGADILNTVADMLNQSAEIWRRKAEQTANIAFNAIELAQIDQEIAAALKRKEILELEAKNHAEAIARITARDAMIQGQFTGPALYQWMIQRASAAYYRAFKVAYELALKAERAYQVERKTSTKHIGSGHWDADQRGLLAGEGLLADLERLHLAYIDSPQVGVGEISAEVALSSDQVAALGADGQCEFEVCARDLDRLHPGLYQRRIVSIGVRLEGAIGAPSTVQATLEQQSSRVLTEPSLAGARLLLGETGGALDPSAITWDHVGGGRAAATGCEATPDGLSLRFGDDDRRPFAGTGALSRWRLRIPRASNRHLNLNRLQGARVLLRYDAQDGGPELTRGVIGTEALRVDRGWHLVSLRAQHPKLLDEVAHGAAATLVLTEADLGFHLKPGTLQLGLDGGPLADGERRIAVRAILASGTPEEQAPRLTVNGEDGVGQTGLYATPEPAQRGPRRWELTLCCDGVDSAEALPLEDVVLLIPYEGELDWSGLVDS